MDPIKILRRSWQILWSYRALWVFGLIVTLAVGGSSGGGGGNNGVQFQDDHPRGGPPTPESFEQAMRQLRSELDRVFERGLPDIDLSAGQLTTVLWIVGAFVVLMLLIGIGVAVARYVSETAMIRMVNDYESSGAQVTVREGFRLGWSVSAWRLFLINLIVKLPGLLFIALLIIVGVSVFMIVRDGGGEFGFAGIAGLVALVFGSALVVAVLTVLLHLLRNFFWRVCVLEEVGVGESLSRGFAIVREEWKDVGLMWLVMVGLGIVWAVAFTLAVILTIPVLLVTAIAGLLVAALPAVLLAGLFSLFLSGYWPWIMGALFVAPLFFTITFSPWLMLDGWRQVFASSVWTLTYRELKAPPAEA
jgi:hypothetical protein